VVREPVSVSDKSDQRNAVIAPEPSGMPERRIRHGILLGLVATALAAAIATSGKDWLRVLIAPAWRIGALASGSTASPSLAVALLVALFVGFAIGFVATPPADSARPGGRETRRVGVNLAALCGVVALELFCYSGIASWLLESVGARRALGGEFPLVLATRLIPGALVFLILAFAAVFAVRRNPAALRTVLVAVWVCQFMLLAGSVSWYVSPAGPAQ
jgi:hypothetical protein